MAQFRPVSSCKLQEVKGLEQGRSQNSGFKPHRSRAAPGMILVPCNHKYSAMIDQLIKLVQQNASDEIVNNQAIPNEYNDEAMKDIGNEIYNGFQNEAKQGNVQEIATLFQKEDTAAGLSSNSAITSIISNVAAKLGSKFGVSPQIANSIAAGLVPKIVNQFIHKAKDPNDQDFDLQEIVKSFTGNSNIGELAGQFTGGNKNIGDAIGGFFKK